jgi:DNA-binding NarL/FixJ family response regulator
MILFIDDEKRYVKNYIEELESVRFEVNYLNNVGDALEFIKSEESKKIEAIILDAMMPFNEGFADEEAKVGIEFYKKFREDFPNTKVFVLTNVSREDVRDFFDKQKDCYFDRKDDSMPVEFATKVYQELRKQG